MVQTLVVVHDRAGGHPPPYLPELTRAGNVAVIDYERTDRLADHAEAAWLIDIQMMNVSKALHLQTAIGKAGSAPRLLVVPSRDRWNTVQARALGATAVVPRPVNVKAVLKYVTPGRPRIVHPDTASVAREPRKAPLPSPILQRDAAPLPEPEQENGVSRPTEIAIASIASAAAALDHVFWACVANAPIDVEIVDTATSGVSSALEEISLENWLDLVRRHHAGTYQHILLTMGIAVSFGRKLALDDTDITRLALGGLMHDIGKCWIPEEILAKPGKLTEEEFDVVRRHSREGRLAFERSGIGLDEVVLDMIHHHHEYLDGSGYPDRLVGDAIRPLTRIMTVCDVFAALVERRSYRPPLAPRNALSILDAMAKAGRVDGRLVERLTDLILDEGYRL